MSETEVVHLLKTRIRREFGTQAGYAESIGVTPAFVSAIIRGRKTPSGKVLDDLGLTQVRTFKPKGEW